MSSTNFQTYDQVGKKEDVSAIISDISPTDTPVVSTANRESAINTYFQYQIDSLAAVDTSNAQVEGAEAKDANITPTTMLNGNTQIFSKTIKLSGSAEAVQTHGRDSELAMQIEKKAKELKRDMEFAAVGADIATNSGADGTARVTASLINMIDAGNKVDDGVAGTVFTEDNLMVLLENMFSEGADPDILLTSPKNVMGIAAWMTASAKNRTRDFGAGKELVNTIDFLVTPFGQLEVVLDKFQSDNHVVAYDSEMFTIKELRPVFTEQLAKDGDYEKHQILGEMGYKIDNPKSHGCLFKA